MVFKERKHYHNFIEIPFKIKMMILCKFIVVLRVYLMKVNSQALSHRKKEKIKKTRWRILTSNTQLKTARWERLDVVRARPSQYIRSARWSAIPIGI